MQSQKTIAFVKQLQSNGISVPFVFWDERFSTQRAKDLIKRQTKRKKISEIPKADIDSTAAAIVLDSFLMHLFTHR